VALFRVSGPAAGAALQALAGRDFAPRRATLARLVDPALAEPIDDALVTWFPAPASFTGEDVAEIGVTGGPAVVAAMLRALAGIAGLRLAQPGEFARRAFDNGRLDLTEAEGLADLIDATSEAQRRQALRQASGGLKALAERWHEALIGLLAEIEASLDFGEDEADVAERMVGDTAPAIAALAAEIEAHLGRYRFAERLRRGVTVVVVGRPNVGKSSLVNALARRDVAIVADEPGTTRDLIEVHLELGGVPVVLVDTAGLREPGGGVEAEGIRRARTRAEEADIVLSVVDVGEPPLAGAIGVRSKLDVRAPSSDGLIDVSAVTGANLDRLIDVLARQAAELTGAGEDLLVSQERQRAALAACSGALRMAGAEPDPVLRAESLRAALKALGDLTGRTSVERILDTVFGRFCIGK
jgi:tRNA modification GTPase